MTLGWHHCITCYQILIAATRFLSGIRRWEHRCQVWGFDKADDLHHLATLAPMGRGIVTKSHAFLGILSCAFCISLRFLDFETSEFSCSVPRSEEALCDDTPAQVNGGSVRDGTCEPRLWNMGASLTLLVALATSSLVLFQYVAWISSRG